MTIEPEFAKRISLVAAVGRRTGAACIEAQGILENSGLLPLLVLGCFVPGSVLLVLTEEAS